MEQDVREITEESKDKMNKLIEQVVEIMKEEKATFLRLTIDKVGEDDYSADITVSDRVVEE